MIKRRRIRFSALLFLAVFCVYGLFTKPEISVEPVKMEPGSLQVHYIDVGQGDATLITCDGHHMLIDAGGNDKGTYVQDYLQKQGVERLDYAIGTHPDADHIGGLDVILYKFDTDLVMMPEYEKDTRTYDDVIQTVKNRVQKMIVPEAGRNYKLGSAVFTVVAPNKKYGDGNNNSIVLLLQNGRNRFLFTGDAEEESEKDILTAGWDISADVYKVGHHGSAGSSSEAFLEAVGASYGIISVGSENSYGHPSDETLQRLRDNGIQIFRTDEQGTIIAASDGEQITWKVQRNK